MMFPLGLLPVSVKEAEDSETVTLPKLPLLERLRGEEDDVFGETSSNRGDG